MYHSMFCPSRSCAAKAGLLIALCATSAAGFAASIGDMPAQLGPRPFYLVDEMSPSPLKDTLQACAENTREYTHRDFSIGHRGAALQFPEHTRESWVAARRMGAGILECDVTFTADGELVCRHDQCDLHTTTNILRTPLAAKCSVPFQAAQFDADGNMTSAARARCCASDLTWSEFKSLSGKMEASDRRATTVDQYLGGTADFRTDLYSSGSVLLSHRETVGLFGSIGARYTPELKAVTDGFGTSGFDQQSLARRMIRDYIDAGIPPEEVWPQSFNIEDVMLWIREFPEYGRQAVFLDSRNPVALVAEPPPLSEFQSL